ncbi:hypothetical protein ACH5RR_014984 [Cinchona calisaya]|uniref:Cyclin-D6-1 n=1 Tax=Cinchona calisaya TaxID=153742 RepID=A0ABD2ZVC0_9GENT
MEFDMEYPLMVASSFEETIPALFANELNHMPFQSSFNSSDHHLFSVRCEVFSLISHARYCYKLNPFTTYLAANYIDRFISKTKIREKKRWTFGILAISSLSLAAKMRNTNISVFLSDFQREEGFVFHPQTIHRMEALILSTLSWRMRSITPFSFLNFFISLFKIEDSSLTRALKLRASDIIFNSHHEIKLLEYKPSLVAASALLCATHDLIPKEFSSFRIAISSCEHVKQEKLPKCLNIMQEMVMDNSKEVSGAVLSCTLTPTSVLDKSTSSESENDNNVTVPERDNIKRRRLNQTFKISQIQPC